MRGAWAVLDEIGDGTGFDRWIPTTVPGVTNAVAVSGGDDYAIALRGTGEVLAWGTNTYGQLGTGNTAPQYTPVSVVGLTDPITQISAGAQHVLAMAADGRVWAWGLNTSGRLGDGTTVNQLQPVLIAGPGMVWKPATPVLSESSGVSNTDRNIAVSCPEPDVTLHYTTNGSDPSASDPAIASGGTVTCRSDPDAESGRMRVGAPPSAVVSATYELKAFAPTLAPGGGSFATPQAVTLASATSSTVIRYTLDGQEPTASSPAYASTPIPITTPTMVKARAFRTGWTASDIGSATYWVTGTLNDTPSFQPAAGAYQDDVLVTLTSPDPNATIRYTTDGSDPGDTSPAFRLPLVLTTTTAVKARLFKSGHTAGAIVSATYTLDAPGAVATPLIVPGGGRFATRQTVTITGPAGTTLRYTTTGDEPASTDTSITSGDTLVVDRSMVLKVRAFPASGDPSAPRRADFVISGALVSGSAHQLALKTDRTLWAWGTNTNGQVGNGSTNAVTTPVQVLTDAIAIAARSNRSLALKADGTVWSWGSGIGTSPVQVSTLSNVKAIAQGLDHALALKTDGTVWAWGTNTHGQLGNNNQQSQTVPVQVTGLTGVTAIAAGSSFSAAVHSAGGEDGTVWTWGLNTLNQLGDGTPTNRLTPVRVGSLPAIRDISSNNSGVLALASDGSLYSWGNGASGQLGQGTSANVAVPGRVLVLDHLAFVAAGSGNAVALRNDGSLWAWGDGANNRLPFPPGLNQTTSWEMPRLVHPMPVTPLVLGASGPNWLFGGIDGSVWPLGGTAAISGLTLGDQSWLVGDPDNDGLPTWREYLANLDPLRADTNRDGLPDGADISNGGAPDDPDVDRDGLANWREIAAGTDPFLADTDGDAVLDGVDEFPLDPTRSLPPTPTPGDTQAPIITLTQPASAVPIP